MIRHDTIRYDITQPSTPTQYSPGLDTDVDVDLDLDLDTNKTATRQRLFSF
jgi:hypothetical protein